MTAGNPPWEGLGVSGKFLPEPPPIPVDRHRLQSLVRGELEPEEQDAVFELIAAFRSWYDAYVDVVTHEGAARLVETLANDDETVQEKDRATEVMPAANGGDRIAEGPEPTIGSTWPSIDIPSTGELLATFNTGDQTGTVGDVECWTIEANKVAIEFSLRRGPICTLEVRLFGALNLVSSVHCDAILYRGEETVARGEKQVGKLTFTLLTPEVAGLTLEIVHRRGDQHTLLQVPVGK